MPKYKVVDGHKKIDGKLLAIGDVVECTEDVATQLRLEPIMQKPALSKAEGTEESQKSADGSWDTEDKKGKKKGK